MRILALLPLVWLAYVSVSGSPGGTRAPAAPPDAMPHLSPCGILAPVPEGWTCIRLFRRDALVGAYFDRASGVLATFAYGGLLAEKRVQLMHDAGYRREAKKFSGSVGPTKYAGFVIDEDPESFVAMRRREDEEMCMECGPVPEEDRFPRKSTDDELLVPPTGSRRWGITFFESDRAPLSFNALVCNDYQEARLRELVLGASRISHMSVPNVDPCCVTPEWPMEVAMDTPLDEVLSTQLPPAWLIADRCDGLILAYSVVAKSGDAQKEAILRFNRSGKLVGRRIRDVGPGPGAVRGTEER